VGLIAGAAWRDKHSRRPFATRAPGTSVYLQTRHGDTMQSISSCLRLSLLLLLPTEGATRARQARTAPEHSHKTTTLR
jgi:hypothetical protein